MRLSELAGWVVFARWPNGNGYERVCASLDEAVAYVARVVSYGFSADEITYTVVEVRM